MITGFCYDKVKVVVGPRSYINEKLGEDIRLHAVFMIPIEDQIWIYHSRLNALIHCTDEDVPWQDSGDYV